MAGVAPIAALVRLGTAAAPLAAIPSGAGSFRAPCSTRTRSIAEAACLDRHNTHACHPTHTSLLLLLLSRPLGKCPVALRCCIHCVDQR